MDDFKKNKPGWVATPDDYRLMFKEINGFWVEFTNNLPEYSGMTLAWYLHEMDIVIPEGCQFCRIHRGDECIEYRDCGSYVRIDYERKKVDL